MKENDVSHKRKCVHDRTLWKDTSTALYERGWKVPWTRLGMFILEYILESKPEAAEYWVHGLSRTFISQRKSFSLKSDGQLTEGDGRTLLLTPTQGRNEGADGTPIFQTMFQVGFLGFHGNEAILRFHDHPGYRVFAWVSENSNDIRQIIHVKILGKNKSNFMCFTYV